MGHVAERDQGRVGQPFAEPLGDVRARDRVEHSPDEGERDVGALQRADPAVLELAPLGHVADQLVEVQVAVVALQRPPDVGAVSRGVEPVGERRLQRRGQDLFVEIRAELGPLRGVGQRVLNRLR